MPKACGCGEEGTRLSQPQCPMAWENSRSWGNSPGWGNGQWGASADPRQRCHCHQQCPSWAQAQPKLSLSKDGPLGVLFGRCHPLMWPRRPTRPASTRLLSVGDNSTLGT